jgi:hypothetical protein
VQDELIGRAERAQLDVWVTEAWPGTGRWSCWPAGQGQQDLVGQEHPDPLQEAVHECFAVQGGTSPFGPIVEGLRSYRRAAGHVPLVEGPLAGHLAMLLPELGPPAPVGDRATLFEAIRQALAGIAARRPTVLFLDDLSGRTTLRRSCWRPGAFAGLEPLLVLGAFRSDELPRGPVRRRAASCAELPGCGRSLSSRSMRGQRDPARADTGTVAPSLRRAGLGAPPPTHVRSRGNSRPSRERPPGTGAVRLGAVGR